MDAAEALLKSWRIFHMLYVILVYLSHACNNALTINYYSQSLKMLDGSTLHYLVHTVNFKTQRKCWCDTLPVIIILIFYVTIICSLVKSFFVLSVNCIILLYYNWLRLKWMITLISCVPKNFKFFLFILFFPLFFPHTESLEVLQQIKVSPFTLTLCSPVPGWEMRFTCIDTSPTEPLGDWPERTPKQ